MIDIQNILFNNNLSKSKFKKIYFKIKIKHIVRKISREQAKIMYNKTYETYMDVIKQFFK